MKQYNILIPEMGEGVNEATITSFLKKVGDPVEEGDVLVEISTDKINNEICSEHEGIVAKIYGAENEVIKVGETVMSLTLKSDRAETPKEKAPADTTNITSPKTGTNTTEKKAETKPKAIGGETLRAKEKEISETNTDILLGNVREKIRLLKTKIEGNTLPLPASKIEETPKKTKSESESEKTEILKGKNTFLSPLIKSIIKAENLSKEEILSLDGSGKNGRITKTDVLEYLDKKQTPNTPKRETGKKSRNEEETETLSPVRKTIAQNMVISQQTIPDAVSIEEIFIDELVRFKKSHQASFAEKSIKLTFSPIIMYAVVLALKENKRIYAVLKGNTLHFPSHINLGFALAKENGDLIVPVIKSAEKMNFEAFVKAYNHTIQKVLENKTTLEDLSGCNFTVSNLGSYKGTFGIPIIAPGQSATMSIGTITKRPTVITENGEDKIGIKNGSWFVLSHDHRTLDGQPAGKFFQSLKKYINTFENIITP